MEDSSDINPFQAPLSTEAPVSFREVVRNRKLADRSARLVAWVADGLLGFTILLPAFYFLGSIGTFYSTQQSWFGELVAASIWISAYYFIHGYWLATRGQTVGKILMGIRIEDRKTSELIPMWRMVLLRDLPIMLPAYLLSFLIRNRNLVGLLGEDLSLFVYLIDFIFIFTASKRCLHDRIANTKVVRTWS